MLKNKIFVLTLVCGCFASYAQLVLNTPYSRFGIGTQVNTSNAFYQSMAGVGNSYASNRFINVSNPALLSRTGMTNFELGVSYNGLQVSEGGASNKSQNVSFDYLRMAFPIKNNYCFAFGLSPYSQVNYSTVVESNLDSTTSTTDTYKGDGGISKMSLTQSFALIRDSIRKNSLTIGLDASFLAGSIDRSSQSLLATNGKNNISYSSLINSSIYRGFMFNIGAAYRKELFVGNTFQTIKNPKCDPSLQGKVAVVPKINFKEQIELRAQNSTKIKYAIIYPNSNEVKVEEGIKKSEKREVLLAYYHSFIKTGYGVLILKEGENQSFSDLKNDYLDAVKELKLSAETKTADYENATNYSEQYLKYGSGIFIHAGASYEIGSKLNTSGSESITRIRTATGDVFDTYEISSFDKLNTSLPSTLRLGVSIDKPQVKGSSICGNMKKPIWAIAADLNLYQWSVFSNAGINAGFSNTFRFALGGSITPNPKNEKLKFNTGFRRLLNTTSYQSGVYYQTMPYTYDDKSVSELGYNFGFTLPTNHDGGLLTLSLGVATRGNDLKQNYFKAGLGFTINETNWFKPVRVGR